MCAIFEQKENRMTSAEVKKFYESGEVDKIYKQCIKYFERIDNCADKLLGDLLDEYELKYAQQEMNGCQVKLNCIAGAFEALLTEHENNFIVEEENKIEKVRVQDQNHCKAVARQKVSDLRRYASDFSRYVQSAQSIVITCQSLLKRITVQKANAEVDFCGDNSQIQEQEQTSNKKGW
jgi:hypothetical protein